MKKIITYGTFDLFHQGHYNLLKRAKELGDYLIVGVTTEHFDEARGKVNVINSTIERIESVRATGLADQIIIEDHEGQKKEDILKYGVDTFVLGSDWIGAYDYLSPYCKVVYLDRTPDISSTMLREEKFKIVRTGIVGSGRMAPRFISEAKYVSGISITHIFNPEGEKKEKFESEYGVCFETRDYDHFLENVDAVYIASPNETHFVYAKRAIESGKHVLCEKPLGFTKMDTEYIYNLARQRGVILMEAVKVAYCPGFQQLINVAKSGKIGEIRDVEACFTRLANIESRERADARYGGSFLEFGSYSMLPIVKLLGREYNDISISALYDEKGVDIYTKVQFHYPNGLAMAKMGVGVKSEGQLVVAGTKGYILAPSPWWLTKRFEIHYEDSQKIDIYEPAFQGDGLRYEISEFVFKINGYEKNGFKLTAGEAIFMADITEKFMDKKKKDLEG